MDRASINNNVNKIEVGEKTLSILALVFSVAAGVASIWSIWEMSKYERESRILQQQVMDQSALLLREGIRQPGDQTNGPAGNLDYKRK